MIFIFIFLKIKFENHCNIYFPDVECNYTRKVLLYGPMFCAPIKVQENPDEPNVSTSFIEFLLQT